MTASPSPAPGPPAPSVVASRVFLVGYRGTGKTTVARLVAEGLGWRWADMDDLVEAAAGRTIRRIFAEEGETGFRHRESLVLEELCRRDRHVIATGGGVILAPGNRERLRGAGLVVWLTADPDTLHARMTGDAATAERRPALTVGGRAEVAHLLAAREPLYRETAHATVATAGRSPGAVAADVLRLVASAGPVGEP